MSDPSNNPQPDNLRRGAIAAVLAANLIAVAVVFLHGPAVELGLTAGDTFQWMQHAHAAAHQPGLLFVDLDSFYRPSTTWSLVADRTLWGGFEARGFRISSLILHILAGLVLAVVGRRLGLGSVAATVVALVWVTSPFTDESVFIIAQRGQPLLLLSWLALVVAWPRSGESWSGWRAAFAGLAILAAASTKETWVVTPALVLALELERHGSLRQAFRPTVLVGIGVAIYVVIYFLAFPSDKTYYELGPHVAARIPTQMAAFLSLEEPMPFALETSFLGVLALAVVVALAVVCLRWRTPGVWVALFLLVLPTLPTLPVPFMPQRFLAIPYAGFLLLMAIWFNAVTERLPRWRWPIRSVACIVVAMVVVAGAAIVRADLDDYRRMAAAHDALLAEAAGVARTVASGVTVLVVRDESSQPLLEILREPRGFAKLPYTRHNDPYGLIDAAALFEWVIADEGIRVEHVSDWGTACAGEEGEVLIHIDGGFVESGPVADLAVEAERWRAEGRRVRVVHAVPLR